MFVKKSCSANSLLNIQIQMCYSIADRLIRIRVLLILVGVVLGGLIGKLCAGVPALSWLSYGQSFGFVNPMVLDLGILVLTFGFTVDITVAGILGIVIAIIIYRLL